MSSKQPEDAYEISWLIRRLFRAMAQNANERLASRDLSAADRAVIEFLYPDEALAVPEIARRYQVSRQHVQTTANKLINKKLIKLKTNPQHKRSSLLTLTNKGKRLFVSIRKDDEEVLQKVFEGISHGDVTVTRKTLKRLISQLR